MYKRLNLFVTLLFFLAACTPQAEVTPTAEAATEVAPGGIVVEDQSVFWLELRETRFGFGLVIPCWWQVDGMPAEGNVSTMTLSNFDDAFFKEYSKDGDWIGGVPPQGVMSMTITAAVADPSLSDADAYLSYVDPATTEVVASQSQNFGTNAYTVLTLKNKQNPNLAALSVYVTRLAPDTILVFNSYPPETIVSSDFAAILSSYARTESIPVTFPSYAPQPALGDLICPF
ncbi:MAG: hypothetical protein J0L96_13350 [Anaerolineae bacterium]|nr:hypothetical protein [Anaerolineae bacterium]